MMPYLELWSGILLEVFAGFIIMNFLCMSTWRNSRPRWLNWMRCPTGDQEVTGSAPAKVSNILSWRLIMKYFLRSFSPFR